MNRAEGGNGCHIVWGRAPRAMLASLLLRGGLAISEAGLSLFSGGARV